MCICPAPCTQSCGNGTHVCAPHWKSSSLSSRISLNDECCNVAATVRPYHCQCSVQTPLARVQWYRHLPAVHRVQMSAVSPHRVKIQVFSWFTIFREEHVVHDDLLRCSRHHSLLFSLPRLASDVFCCWRRRVGGRKDAEIDTCDVLFSSSPLWKRRLLFLGPSYPAVPAAIARSEMLHVDEVRRALASSAGSAHIHK